MLFSRVGLRLIPTSYVKITLKRRKSLSCQGIMFFFSFSFPFEDFVCPRCDSGFIEEVNEDSRYSSFDVEDIFLSGNWKHTVPFPDV